MQDAIDVLNRADASAAARMSVLMDLTDDVHEIIGDLRKLQEEMTDDLDAAALGAVSDAAGANAIRSSVALGMSIAAIAVALFSVWVGAA